MDQALLLDKYYFEKTPMISFPKHALQRAICIRLYGTALATRPPGLEIALNAPVLVLVANPNGRKTVLFAIATPHD